LNDSYLYHDVIETTVRQLLESFRSSLPDLSHIAVFLPDNNLSINFRKQLLTSLPASCNKAVIPPWCGTLRDWVTQFISLPHAQTGAQQGKHITIISDQARQLMFIEALEQYPTLFKKENKWQVMLALLKLFDELNLHNATISDSKDDWLGFVQKAYDMDQNHAHLQREASLIHTLWHAWHNQLDANNLLDASSAYITRLGVTANQLEKKLPQNFYCYVTSTERLTPCEIDFIQLLKNNDKCSIFSDKSKPDDNNNELHEFIKEAYSFQTLPLKKRAENFKKREFKNEAKQTKFPFSIYHATDAENEARIIDLQVRLWLSEGKQRIGIISEDRKLSRRLRALLERANVPMQDMAGWSLSTTSAAATLERWLECIEEDFDHRPMLDLLKSHFFSTDVDHDTHLENVYRLERDIIQHENIKHGLSRYRNHLKYRLNKLENWPKNSYDDIYKLLENLQSYSEPLQRLHRSGDNYGKNINLKTFLDILIDSLIDLGIYASFQDDPAGFLIIQTLHKMQKCLEHANPGLSWNDFRTWLGITLEAQLFIPQAGTSPVQLMTLEQSDLKRFDALIIAAADNQHMPGTPDDSPFFNQGTRKSLGLETWDVKRTRRLRLFQQLLCSAPEILISCQSENKGEPVPLSPWIETLLNFYHLSYDKSLLNKDINQLLEMNPGVFICDTEESPTIEKQPSPTIPCSMAPRRISAGAHQRLINCPYQFFSGDVLRLKAPEEISEELQKSDYGKRVHLILQAFHQQTKNLPAPFSEKITYENRDSAIQYLTELSQTIFKRDLEDNALHRSWLHRWIAHIPGYIDWQINQQLEWTVSETEQKYETPIDDETTIFGRLDRIDNSGGHRAIIDYKTGRSANQKDIDSGEDVQLATYALLDDKTEHVSYLSLDEKDGGVKIAASLEGEQLHAVKNDVSERLKTMLDLTRNGQALHAWGDEAVCNHCNFSGLCRRVSWR
jgi:ATP-dependent helicase/nuclease subunit B